MCEWERELGRPQRGRDTRLEEEQEEDCEENAMTQITSVATAAQATNGRNISTNNQYS